MTQVVGIELYTQIYLGKDNALHTVTGTAFVFQQWILSGNHKHPGHLETRRQHSFKRVNTSPPEVLTN